MKSETPRKYRQ